MGIEHSVLPLRGVRARAGFSLIEMIIAVSVLAVLTAIMIPYSRRGEGQLVLAREQALLQGAIVHAKNLSIQKYEETGWGAEVCGWGVHIDPQFMGQDMVVYGIFRDKPGLGGKCDQNPSDKVYTPGAGEAVEPFTVDSRLRLAFPPDVRDIVFVPPEQYVYLDGCSPSDPNPPHASECAARHAAPPDGAIIMLETIDGSFRAGVEFNKAGQISFVQ